MRRHATRQIHQSVCRWRTGSVQEQAHSASKSQLFQCQRAPELCTDIWNAVVSLKCLMVNCANLFEPEQQKFQPKRSHTERQHEEDRRHVGQIVLEHSTGFTPSGTQKTRRGSTGEEPGQNRPSTRRMCRLHADESRLD